MRRSHMILLLILSIAIGIAMASQTAVNSQLQQYLNSPLQSAFFSFLIGTICLALLVLFEPADRPTLQQLTHVPLWLWTGGLLGLYAISVSIYSAPKLGFLTFTGVVLFGQIITSMLLDQFALLGVEKNPINWQRAFGAGLIAVGIIFTLQH
ncbi:DMT family transporter [Acinetobacter puyangensis]|uniref:DMT family transporter n=1 Tax=Acinetobacter puyangensis TaxID=1096779 RepID=UPI003A4D6114